MRVALSCQITHKNLLTVAITQAENCAAWKEAKPLRQKTRDHSSDNVSVLFNFLIVAFLLIGFLLS